MSLAGAGALAGVGFCLGLLNFATLWRTLPWALKTRYPAVFILTSAAVRCLALALALVVLAGGDIWCTVAGVGGVLGARSLCLFRFGWPAGAQRSR